FTVVSQHLLVRLDLLAILRRFLLILLSQVKVIMGGLRNLHFLSRSVTGMSMFRLLGARHNGRRKGQQQAKCADDKPSGCFAIPLTLNFEHVFSPYDEMMSSGSARLFSSGASLVLLFIGDDPTLDEAAHQPSGAVTRCSTARVRSEMWSW